MLGSFVAVLVALPSFLWQVHFGYPMLELLRAAQHGKNIIVGPLEYLGQQLWISGLLAPFWIIGLIWLFLRPRVRFLAYAYVLLIAIMIALHGKHYYPANAYPYLIAAGCVQIENWTSKLRRTRWAIAMATVLGLVFFPVVMPVLPEARPASYYTKLHSFLHISRESVETEHVILDETGVVQKSGVSPASIPDYLALVGDAADGYPGLPGWGAKSSAAVLAKFLHLESVPHDCREWRVNAANASALAGTLCSEWGRAVLFRTLATFRTDIVLFGEVDQLRWNGPTPAFDALAAQLDKARTGKRHSGTRRSPSTSVTRRVSSIRKADTTPLSLEEEMPWKCRHLVVGTGTGAMPVMDEVRCSITWTSWSIQIFLQAC